jgi:hypothetical protein
MSMQKRTKTILLVALGILLLLVVGWQFFKYQFVHRQLAQAVEEKTKGLYRLNYDHLVFDEFAGTLQVNNIDIQPDTAVYQQLRSEGKEPHMLLQIHVDALDIARVKTPKALFDKEIEGGKVEITGAQIRIMVEQFKKDSSVYNPTRDLTKQLLGKLLKIAIDSVEIKDASVVIGAIDGSGKPFRGDNVSLLLSHVHIDTSTREDSATILFSRQLSLECQRLHLPSGNDKYAIGIDSVRFTSMDNGLHIGEVKIHPVLSETAFAASFPVQTDRYDFLLKNIDLRNIHRGALWHKIVQADSLIIGESAFRVYRDLSRPPDTSSRVGNYPQQLLMRLPFPVSIRKMIFPHSYIEYKERNAKSLAAGRVQFHHVRATIHNVTNRRDDIQKDNRCTIDFHSLFLNKAPVNARLILFLKDRRGRFTIDGDLDNIEATDLNPLTEPMALTRLEKGTINHLQFSIQGADSAADGRVQLAYEDLKVSMLKRDNGDGSYDKKGLTSFLANIMIRNSSHGADPTPEDVHFQRILNKSMFNLIWKTLFTGIKKSAIKK